MRDLWMKCAGVILAAATIGSLAAVAQTAPITLTVDLTDAPRKILHATEVMPVTPGPLTVVYPKWIPGEHGPTGPIVNMAGFFITANGQPVKWERDKVDMFAFHLTVPQGATRLEIKIDFLTPPELSGFSAGGSTSENLALLSWNTLLVYPDGAKASEVMVTPAVKVPEGWKFGTALDRDGETAGAAEGATRFKTVSLEQLIDSPVLAGRYFREVALAPEISPKHYLDMGRNRWSCRRNISRSSTSWCARAALSIRAGTMARITFW
jgi:predicted metalloprotease with PDZ domain